MDVIDFFFYSLLLLLTCCYVYYRYYHSSNNLVQCLCYGKLNPLGDVCLILNMTLLLKAWVRLQLLILLYRRILSVFCYILKSFVSSFTSVLQVNECLGCFLYFLLVFFTFSLQQTSAHLFKMIALCFKQIWSDPALSRSQLACGGCPKNPANHQMREGRLTVMGQKTPHARQMLQKSCCVKESEPAHRALTDRLLRVRWIQWGFFSLVFLARFSQNPLHRGTFSVLKILRNNPKQSGDSLNHRS